jgi:penicillin-insensitive murein DD-endopeptidase
MMFNYQNTKSQSRLVVPFLMIGLLFVFMGTASGTKESKAKDLFGKKSEPSSQYPSSYGSYAKGCLAGAQELPETGATWQAMRLSRNRNWGHPDTISFIQDLSRTVSSFDGWKGLYIGDISQPRGGPMLSGHRSHQIGLDVDIWMLPAKDLSLSRKRREEISSISMQRSKGAYVNSKWSPQHHALLRAAAQDPKVARIFVFAGAKVQMCNDETGDRTWLRKIRPWFGHHYHFHVRLLCPEDSSECENQAPPPEGDGCAEAEEWVDGILNPKPAGKSSPRQSIYMIDLPNSCQDVLQSP